MQGSLEGADVDVKNQMDQVKMQVNKVNQVKNQVNQVNMQVNQEVDPFYMLASPNLTLPPPAHVPTMQV